MTKIKMAETAANRIRRIGVLLYYSLGECSPVLHLSWKGAKTRVDYNFSAPNDDPIIPLEFAVNFPRSLQAASRLHPTPDAWTSAERQPRATDRLLASTIQGLFTFALIGRSQLHAVHARMPGTNRMECATNWLHDHHEPEC